MFSIEKRLNSRIISFFERKGFHATIDRIRWRRIVRIELYDVILTRKSAPGQYVRIERMAVRLSPWRCLVHFALEGEMTLRQIDTTLKEISEKTFSLESLICTFRIRRKFQIARLDIGNIVIAFQLVQEKKFFDFSLEVIDAGWNDIIDVLQKNLICRFIAESRSDSKLSLSILFRKSKENPEQHYFNAKIDPGDFLRHPKNIFPENSDIRPDFLKNVLMAKYAPTTYIPFDQIPKDIVNAFVCFEDPKYWKHPGICVYSLGCAINRNINHKKIVRGASTITMQMTRNLFLNHNRDFIRKIEEGIIALLLENYYKIDKKTIFELYANLIEFAPGVYGMAAASRFYFGKEADDLSLTEILVLTYITPRPKHFYEALLLKTKQLQHNLCHHIYFYAGQMIRKGLISWEKGQNIDHCILFSERFGTLLLFENNEAKEKSENNIPENVAKLMRAYPLSIKEYDGQYIHLFNGDKVKYSKPGERNDTERLNDPCIDDMFLYPYYKGEQVDSMKKNDAGRIRHEELLMKMYGSSPQEVGKHLVAICWCPKLLNQKLYTTTVNNVHLQFQRISDELDEHPELIDFLQSGGIFNWKEISGSKRLSAHCFGIAIDIAVNHSRYWWWDQKEECGQKCNIPQIVVDIFEKYGFIWGGRWQHYDTMHFEYRPELLLE